MDTHKVAIWGITFVVCLSLVIPSLGASFTVCPAGQFRSRETDSCEICSMCPMNEIVRRPCSQFRDTTCGPFYEFEFFNQGKEDSEDSEGQERHDKEFNLFKFASTKSPLLPEPNSENPDDGQGHVNVQERISVNVPYLRDNTTKWRDLCYGLIAVLAVVTFLFVSYVAYTQVQMRKMKADSKLLNTHETREEPVYCYTQMFTAEELTNKNKPKPSTSRTPVYKPGSAKRMNSANARALPNDYVMHMREANQTIQDGVSAEQNQLLPVIPEGSCTESDHVRVLYTNQK